MRLRHPRILAAAAALLAAITVACGGGSDEPQEAEVAATNIPTATPFAVEPSPTIVSASTRAQTAELVYIVEPGDVLSLIAERFETTIAAIMERNDISDATLIFVGQALVIPPAPDPVTTATAGPPARGTSAYVVQPGDTAFAIATAFNTTLAEIAAANGLTVDALNRLNVGQELIIPGAP